MHDQLVSSTQHKISKYESFCSFPLLDFRIGYFGGIGKFVIGKISYIPVIHSDKIYEMKTFKF